MKYTMKYVLTFKGYEYGFQTIKEVVCFLQDQGYSLPLNASLALVARSLHERDGVSLSLRMSVEEN